MLKRIVMSFIAMAALLAGPVGAQPKTDEPHFYAGFGVGRSDSNLDGVVIDNKDRAFKGFGGYQFNRYFAVEGGVIDLGRATIPGTSFDSTALYASAVGSLPITEQFALIGKAGLARTETEFSTGGSDQATEPTYGLGVRYDFTRQLGVRGEWERYRASTSPFSGKNDIDIFMISAIYRFR